MHGVFLQATPFFEFSLDLLNSKFLEGFFTLPQGYLYQMLFRERTLFLTHKNPKVCGNFQEIPNILTKYELQLLIIKLLIRIKHVQRPLTQLEVSVPVLSPSTDFVSRRAICSNCSVNANIKGTLTQI